MHTKSTRTPFPLSICKRVVDFILSTHNRYYHAMLRVSSYANTNHFELYIRWLTPKYVD